MPPAPRIAARIGWLEALDPRYLRTPSVLALIAANLIPLAGVLYWGWDLYGLMLLYWMETGIIGFFAILQIALTSRWGALFMVPFFTVHFGGFMAGHLLFVTLLFGGERGNHGGLIEALPSIVGSALSESGLWLALAGLLLSRGFSFVVSVLVPLMRGGLAAFGGSAAGDPMTGVYGRVVVLHVTLILGGLLVSASGSALPVFVLLIAIKTVVDVAAHVRKNFSPAR